MADALVKSFCEMLIPAARLTTEEQSKEFQKSLIKVLRLRTIKMDPHEGSIRIFLKKVYNAVEPAGANTYTSLGKRGTYGEVFTIAGKNTIVKKIDFFQEDDTQSYRNFFAILKELFIQFILSNDPDLGKHVPKLFSIKKYGPHSVLVEMEKADYTLLDLLNDIKAREGVLDFNKIRPKIKEILTILIKLNQKYKFAHRDFKLDNVMYADIGPEKVVKIIDFGMSCITINFEGQEVNIINDVYYVQTSKCRIEQDIGLFLLNFIYTFQDDIDQEFTQFMKNARVFNFRKHLEAINNKLSLFHRGYNKNGELFDTAPVSGLFKPADIMLLLGILRLKTPAISKAVNPTLGLSRRSSRIANRATRKTSTGTKPWQRPKA